MKFEPPAFGPAVLFEELGMGLAIRRMRDDVAEIEALAALRHAAFFEGSARTLDVERSQLATFARKQGENQLGIVAEFDGTIAGCCLIVPHELDQHHDLGPWLAGLVVEPAMRGRGIGSALVQAVEDEARQRSIDRLYLYTSGAEPFYATLGWVALELFCDGDGIDSTLMTKDLASRPA